MNRPELFHTYRPTCLEEVVGQSLAVKSIQRFFANDSLPHALLLSGPSGVGKTTLGYIIAHKLGAKRSALKEINCASVEKATQLIRTAESATEHPPIFAPCWAWILDEIQSFSRAAFAQQAMLKMLENARRPWAYFILCTTDPDKLIRTVRTRCTHIKLSPVEDKDLEELVKRVVVKERVKLSKEVLHKIVDESKGSARDALKFLHQVIDLDSEEDKLNCIEVQDSEKSAIEIVFALLYKKPTWDKLVPLIRKNMMAEPESFRRLVLKVATTELLKGNHNAGRAFDIISCFSNPWYDCPSSGLAASCYEVVQKAKHG